MLLIWYFYDVFRLFCIHNFKIIVKGIQIKCYLWKIVTKCLLYQPMSV